MARGAIRATPQIPTPPITAAHGVFSRPDSSHRICDSPPKGSPKSDMYVELSLFLFLERATRNPQPEKRKRKLNALLVSAISPLRASRHRFTKTFQKN